MTEERLNNCLLVHVYKEIAEELDLEVISRDFVRADDARKKHFGCFRFVFFRSIKHYSWCYCGNVSSNYE